MTHAVALPNRAPKGPGISSLENRSPSPAYTETARTCPVQPKIQRAPLKYRNAWGTTSIVDCTSGLVYQFQGGVHRTQRCAVIPTQSPEFGWVLFVAREWLDRSPVRHFRVPCPSRKSKIPSSLSV